MRAPSDRARFLRAVAAAVLLFLLLEVVGLNRLRHTAA